ncbi:adenylate/guanylate cyclase domain-containing protein [Spirulina sp. 06S082]|uniref:adenylate/guanylate cyclase domain-containing protein n=1 Tax=Spirulina sp. 06S082 TaxID=3110248 RepID=UPI002B20416E|nr:adenylate/guanylate cyclase domain-containing protein [Spirulina sp. 06S082]MEA5469678.1 adenylate/guanylate cyclase domain-containing protein [Spirulina sp. 06S082]
MIKLLRKTPISAKIIGLALGVLSFSIVAFTISHNRLRQVQKEIHSLSEYTIPLTNLVAEIDIHVLKQHFHLHRIVRFYEIEPFDRQSITEEIREFKQRGDRVDEELESANNLIKIGLTDLQLPTTRKEFSRLNPILDKIEKEQQYFQDRALEIIQLLAENKKIQARQLENRLEIEEEQFNKEIANILTELNEFTVQAARSSQRHQQKVLHLGIFIATIATITSLFSASAIATGLVQPTRYLTHKIKTIQKGNFNLKIEIKTEDEVGKLTHSFNKMLVELKQKETIKETFGKYVDPRAIAHLMEDPQGTKTGGEKQTMTVCFSDITGIENLENMLVSHESIETINQYLTLMSSPISHHCGVIDKFLGTMIMAFWGEPFTSAKDRDRLACYAALEQINCLDSLRQYLANAIAEIDVNKIDLRIGLATGDLVVGNMGSESSKSYTAIGDAVNLASRLQGASKQYGVRILIAEETRNEVIDFIETREIDRIQVVGKEDSVRVYEVLARKENLQPDLAALRDCFEQGLKAYRQQNWQQAEALLTECLQIKPQDCPSQILRDRVLQFQKNSPPKDWDGVWHLTKK